MLAWSYHPAAEAEVEATVAWLAERDPLVADSFLDDLEQSIAAVRRAPRSFPLWPGVPNRYEIHRCILSRFSFAIAFMVQHGRLVIVAVAHQRRRPRYWAKRLGPRP